MKQLVLLFIVLASVQIVGAQAEDVIRIEIPREKGYERYSDRELRERVYQLERAVVQLQQRVFQLETKPTPPPATPAPVEWTCRMNSFGKTYVGTAATKYRAMADVISQCSKATSASHCPEHDVVCGKE